jgi:hypothetical protein
MHSTASMLNFSKSHKGNNMEQIIINCIKAQLAKPTRTCVNSESAFVRERIEMEADKILARKYWNWAISNASWRAANPVFGGLVVQLQLQLDAIDNAITLPDWATYGT